MVGIQSNDLTRTPDHNANCDSPHDNPNRWLKHTVLKPSKITKRMPVKIRQINRLTFCCFCECLLLYIPTNTQRTQNKLAVRCVHTVTQLLKHRTHSSVAAEREGAREFVFVCVRCLLGRLSAGQVTASYNLRWLPAANFQLQASVAMEAIGSCSKCIPFRRAGRRCARRARASKAN